MSEMPHQLKRASHIRKLTDDAKIFVETMSDEDAAKINEKAQLLVRNLRWHKRILGFVDLQVTSWQRVRHCGSTAYIHSRLMPENSVR